ncbi:MAG TPA: hypothetical protein VHS56_11790 [Candidatus Cybelea sp.]|nr:hypothetical protein [Candidatus Cybelea sp.]
MKTLDAISRALTCAAVVLLAACAGSPAPGAMPQGVASAPHAERGTSWMLAGATAKKSVLLYLSDWRTNDVYVYDYKSGKHVGTLTGFELPGGACVDAKGDVYITSPATGMTTEYAHGGTTPLNTYATNGIAMGCSVDKGGDLAVTDFYSHTPPPSGPGQVCIFKKHTQRSTCYSEPSVCDLMWPGGYDDNGDLIVEGYGETVSRNAICALMHGATSMTTLSLKGSKRDSFTGSVMWDGKYITLTDQAAYENPSAIYQVTLSGSTLTEVGHTQLRAECKGLNTYAASPFIVGQTNTPVNRRQGKLVISGALTSACKFGVGYWSYPQGGHAFKAIRGDFYGAAVSFGT